MTEKTETWYVFEMNPEHVDPMLVEWLNQHGITMLVNELAKTPGVMANVTDELPDYCHKPPKAPELYTPLKIRLACNQMVPVLRSLVDGHDLTRGKPPWIVREPLSENYGRSPNTNVLVDCLMQWLSEIEHTLTRVEECDLVVFEYENSEEFRIIKDSITWIKDKYSSKNADCS